jgi:hypothetical protein
LPTGFAMSVSELPPEPVGADGRESEMFGGFAPLSTGIGRSDISNPPLLHLMTANWMTGHHYRMAHLAALHSDLAGLLRESYQLRMLRYQR